MIPFTIRLAHIDSAQGSNSLRGLKVIEKKDTDIMTTIRLAHSDSYPLSNSLRGNRNVKKISKEIAPALLISFFYIKGWLEHQNKFVYRDWVMDSGAFSAFNSGVNINLDEYIELCIELKKTDPTLTEIFALDVIGDHRASLKNCEKMWEAGVEAIPAYHYGEPEDALMHIAKTYPKIALGGVVLKHESKKIPWAEQCFARVWPKKIHGFAFCSEKALLALPWHSVDATSWEIGPCGFGNWRTFGKMSVRGSKQNLESEIRWYMKLEERMRRHWKKEMKILKCLDDSPTVRLAVQPNSSRFKDLKWKGVNHGKIKK